MNQPEMIGTEREARTLEMLKAASQVVRDIQLPRGIKFMGSLPAKQNIVVRGGKWNLGSTVNLRTVTKKAMRRGMDVQIFHLGKDGCYHLHRTVRGLSGRQWKKYRRYRREAGEPV